jgi:hypothetical protein
MSDTVCSKNDRRERSPRIGFIGEFLAASWGEGMDVRGARASGLEERDDE